MAVRKKRLATKKSGFKSMSDIYGGDLDERNKLVPYRIVADKYEQLTGEKISQNSVCNHYHRGMFKLAKELTQYHGMDMTEEEIHVLSRSAEFAVMVRDLIEAVD